MAGITIPIEIEITPRSKALLAALQATLDDKAAAEAPATRTASSTPSIGAPWPGIEGSAYAGISRGEDGAPDAHLVLLADAPGEDMSWRAAMKLAEQRSDGARMPTRFESALLYANLRDRMDTSAWHWTSTQYSGPRLAPGLQPRLPGLRPQEGRGPRPARPQIAPLTL